MRHKPTRLPPIELLLLNYSYDPLTGIITSKHGNELGNNRDRTSGQCKVRIGKGKTTTIQRLAWALFHRKDPIHHKITHIDGHPWNNRIENLRAVKL